ncbi:MAG: SLC13 family permease [Alphaproteobacteria bacterium]
MLSLSSEAATDLAVVLFIVTYLGMALGRLPGLAIDRTGIALFSAVVLLVAGIRSPAAALHAIDFPTLCVLFGLMALSAQFVLAGFYDWCAARIASLAHGQSLLLAATVAVSGVLSALLANDVVTFATAPVLAGGLLRRGVDPRPYLVALAAASNAGSAATVIGNPQNILIGEAGRLPFLDFLLVCGPPAMAALVVVYAVVSWLYRRELAHRPSPPAFEPPHVDRYQVAKGVLATAALILLFLLPLPRSLGALGIAAALLVSRRFATREIMAQVDWHLLLLFASLFIVNDAFRSTGIAAGAMAWLADQGALPDRLAVLAPLTLAASNTVGNVPAVILLLSLWKAAGAGALYGLALLSTLSGNLLLTGSIANIIVCERAAGAGVTIRFADHARCGIPITLVSLALAGSWLVFAGQMPW